jgi:hypothetical protein
VGPLEDEVTPLSNELAERLLEMHWDLQRLRAELQAAEPQPQPCPACGRGPVQFGSCQACEARVVVQGGPNDVCAAFDAARRTG